MRQGVCVELLATAADSRFELLGIDEVVEFVEKDRQQGKLPPQGAHFPGGGFGRKRQVGQGKRFPLADGFKGEVDLAGPDAAQAAQPAGEAAFGARRMVVTQTRANIAAAQQNDDEKAEAEARKEWRVMYRRLLNAVRADGRTARRYLAWLGSLDDEKTALYLARVLPLVFVEGFEEHLIETATGDGPVLERRAALVGLRARGLAAAAATGQVAAGAKETVLRADATAELALHLPDPSVITKSRDLAKIVADNLSHDEASVRRAAVIALLAARQPLMPERREAVRKLLNDADERIRPLAKKLVQR